jgi:hypothetical protein
MARYGPARLHAVIRGLPAHDLHPAASPAATGITAHQRKISCGGAGLTPVASKENEPSGRLPRREARTRGVFRNDTQAVLQRENAPAAASQKATRQSEKSHFSLGNAFFLQ